MNSIVAARHEHAVAIGTRRDEGRITAVGLHRRFDAAAGCRVDGPDLAAGLADVHPVARGVHPDPLHVLGEWITRVVLSGADVEVAGSVRADAAEVADQGPLARPLDTVRGGGNAEDQLLRARVEHRELAVVLPRLHPIDAAGDDQARSGRRVPVTDHPTGSDDPCDGARPVELPAGDRRAATDDDELPTVVHDGHGADEAELRVEGALGRRAGIEAALIDVAEQVAAIHGPEFERCRHPWARIVGGGHELLRPVDSASGDVDGGDPVVARRDDAVCRRPPPWRRSSTPRSVGTVAITAAVLGSTTCRGPSTVPYTRSPSVVKRAAPARSVASCGRVGGGTGDLPHEAGVRLDETQRAGLVDRGDQVALVVHRDGREREVELDRRPDQGPGCKVGDGQPNPHLRIGLVADPLRIRDPRSISADRWTVSTVESRDRLLRQVDGVHERTGIDVVHRGTVRGHGDRAPRSGDERARHALDALEMRRREEAVGARHRAHERGAAARVIRPPSVRFHGEQVPRHHGRSPRSDARRARERLDLGRLPLVRGLVRAGRDEAAGGHSDGEQRNRGRRASTRSRRFCLRSCLDTVFDLIDGGALLGSGCIEERDLRIGEFGVRAIAPCEDGVEAGSAIQVLVGATIRLPGGRGTRERTHRAEALGVVLEPASETRPRRRERLVSDDERVLLGADQAGTGEAREHTVVRGVLPHRRDRNAAAHRRPVRADLDEAQERGAARRPRVGIERQVELVGRLGDRARDSAGILVPGDRERGALTAQPGLHEGVRDVGKHAGAPAASRRISSTSPGSRRSPARRAGSSMALRSPSGPSGPTRWTPDANSGPMLGSAAHEAEEVGAHGDDHSLSRRRRPSRSARRTRRRAHPGDRNGTVPRTGR